MNNVEFLNSWNELFGMAKSVIVPAVSLLGGWVLLYIKKYIKRTLEMAEATNELNYLQKMNEIRDQVLKEIEKTVRSAVASNMDKAKWMKKESGTLSDDQVAELNASAMDLIMASLPASLTENEGTLLNVIGGSDKLKVIIRNYMEQAVYEYKQGDQNKPCEQPEVIDEGCADRTESMFDDIMSAISAINIPSNIIVEKEKEPEVPVEVPAAEPVNDQKKDIHISF